MNGRDVERIIAIGISVFLTYHTAHMILILVTDFLGDTCKLNGNVIFPLVSIALTSIITVLFFAACLRLGEKLIVKVKGGADE